MRLLPLAVAPLLLAAAHSQDAPSPELQAQLRKLTSTAQTLQHDLPNIACKQSATSQRLREGKVKKEVAFEADLTVVRDQRGELAEHVKYTTVDGKPTTSQQVKMPVFIEGGLDESFFFFLPQLLPCFTFSGDAHRIDYTSVDAFSEERCRVGRGTRGFAIFDDAGNMTHIERSTPSDAARRTHVSAYSSYDLQMTALGAMFYPLSVKVVADIPDGKDILRFTSTYAACRLFQGSLNILPGVVVVPDAPTDAAPHP